MAITEEHYDEITDELDSHDFHNLVMLANSATNSTLFTDLDSIHSLAKRALDYRYNDETHESLEKFHEEIEEVSSDVSEAIEALEKINSVLSKADDVLNDKLYAEELKDD